MINILIAHTALTSVLKAAIDVAVRAANDRRLQAEAVRYANDFLSALAEVGMYVCMYVRTSTYIHVYIQTAPVRSMRFTLTHTQYQRVLLRLPGPVFIMGDMNCNLLDSSANAGKDHLLEMLQSFSLSQYVTQPTYSSGSLLDVVICNSSDIIQRVYAFKCAFSPHHFIRVLLRLPKSQRSLFVSALAF